jgi:hypothetical protein
VEKIVRDQQKLISLPLILSLFSSLILLQPILLSVPLSTATATATIPASFSGRNSKQKPVALWNYASRDRLGQVRLG